MPISIGTRIPPKLGSTGIESLTAWAASIGLQAVDLPNASAESAQVLANNHLKIGTVDGQGVGKLLSRNEQTRRQAVDDICSQIQATAAIGGKVMFMCLVPEDTTQKVSDSLSIYRETFPEIASACESAGVRVAFEGWPGPGPHFATLGYTPEVWRAMFTAVPSNALGLCYDPSHLVRLGIDYLRVLEEFGERIHHCHGKDTALLSEGVYLYGHLGAALTSVPAFSDGPWRYCIPGDGEVNWSRVAYGLYQHGYEGVVSIELEDARYWGSLDKEQLGIRRAKDHLSRQFGA